MDSALLAPGADANARRAAHLTSITLLVNERRPKLLSRFIIDIRQRDPNELAVLNDLTDESLTPMMIAAKSGALGVVKCLFSHGASASMRDSLDRTATDWAIAASHRIVGSCLHSYVLFEMGNTRRGPQAPTLKQALTAGHIYMSRTLLKKTNAPFEIDLLYAAVKASNPLPVVKLLLNGDETLAPRGLGAATRLIDEHSDPLPTVELLAEPLDKNLLLRAAVKAGELSTFRYVSTLPGADLHYNDSEGHSLLYHGAETGRTTIVQELLSHGVGVKLPGCNPLAAAAKNILDTHATRDHDDYGSSFYVKRKTISEAHRNVLAALLKIELPKPFLDEAVNIIRGIKQDQTPWLPSVAPALGVLESEFMKRGAAPRSTAVAPPKQKSKGILNTVLRRHG